MNDADDLLASLADHPGWPFLVQLADEKQQRRLKTISAHLLSGADPNLRDIDVERGERAGAAWLLRQPELARKRIKEDRVTASA